jgi:hypothetical protein
VPWAVAASVSELRLTVTEDNKCRCVCDASWGQHSGEPYHSVTIDFEQVAAVYFGAMRDDGAPPSIMPIDWSEAYFKPKDEQELSEYLRVSASAWRDTGIAPDPGFFRIEGSEWSKRYTPKVEHFFIQGCDAFAEILAAGFTWTRRANEASIRSRN